MTETVKVYINGEIKDVKVSAWVIGGNLLGPSGRFSDQAVRKPDWDKVLPGYDVEETAGGAVCYYATKRRGYDDT